MELAGLIISLGAFLLSAISLIWQLTNHFASMELEMLDVYRDFGKSGPQYIIRLHLTNNSSTSISVSKIVFKNGSNSVAIEHSRLRLIKETHRENRSKLENGVSVITEEITGIGRLYSHELPFRLDGYAIEGGYFYLLDADNVLKIDNGVPLDVEIYTNKKVIKAKVKFMDIKTWKEFEICLD